jgi:hypothetical protein
MNETDRFTRAIAAFDEYHTRDPNTETADGRVYAKELLYALRMTDRLARFSQTASEAAKLAARCQHIGRWELPRDAYPMDKKGYLQWRNEEKMRHASLAEKLLSDCGYDPETISKVKVILLKKELHTNAETQLIEDVACLVFIEHYLGEFAAKHDDDKVIDILRKTLRKMSAAAQTSVTEMLLDPRIQLLVQRAGIQSLIG